jgi:hypothetical protein
VNRSSSATAKSDQMYTLPRLSSSPRICETARRIHEPHYVDRELGEEVYALLPPLEEARRLCEIYLNKAKYL